MADIKSVTSVNLTDSGNLYTVAPTITFTGGFADSSDKIKFGSNSLDLSVNNYTYRDSGVTSMNGWLSFWVWVDSGYLPTGDNLKPLWEMGLKDGSFDYRRRFGTNASGQIVSQNKYSNSGSLFTWSNQSSPGFITEEQWNHVIFNFDGDNDGFVTRRAELFINDSRTYYTNSTSFGGVIADSDILFGVQLQGSFNGTDFDSPSGMYMDNLYIDSDNAGFLVPIRTKLFESDSDGGIYSKSTRPTLAVFQGFDNDSAVATTTIDSNGKVNSITISSGGNYISAPSVLFTQRSPTSVTIGDSASQTLSSGVKVTGEIAHYSDSDGKMHLIHVNADDGKYHSFVADATRKLSFGNVTREILSLDEDNVISNNEQNDDFSPSILDFLDFTENNPFGDPENN